MLFVSLTCESVESEIENNPIKLLEALKTLSHNGNTIQYKWITVLAALNNMAGTKMEDHEQVNDFRKRVKSVCDVVAQLLGKTWLRAVIAEEDDYKNCSTNE